MSTVNSATTGATSITDLMSTVNTKTSKPTDPNSVDANTNKFMTLLVTQLKNQDPMNPLDNAQLTSQLAQLSTVTGINKLNTTLDSLKSSYQSSESMAATNLIGHGVFVDDNFVNVASGKSIMGVSLPAAADSVQVVVTDPSTGKDIKTIDLGAQAAGIVPLTWDGVADGTTKAVANGKYNFRVAASSGGARIANAATLSFDSVSSVRSNATDGVKLNLSTKGQVSMADIKQIM